MRKHAAELKSRHDDIDAHVDVPGQARRTIENTFMSMPSFFGTTRLLQHIGPRELDKVKSLDFSKPLYTAIDFPSRKTDSLDYGLYFLLQLTDSPKPRRMTDASGLRTHTKVRYAEDKAYQRLLKLIDAYLHSNNKKLIPEIISLINANPTLKAANDKAKKKIKVVYRGLGFAEGDDTSNEEIEQREHDQEYVATSLSRRAALNFALQIGHLESAESRRSNSGVIITYKVTPEAILLDTDILETVYNEREILIDARLATIESIDDV